MNNHFAAGICLLLVLGACTDSRQGPPAAAIDLTGFLNGGNNDRFAQVITPANLSFPDDHGEHPAYRIEWWYFTGNLATAAGREFGYQFTIFRYALEPSAHDPVQDVSSWRSSQVYMAHAAISDIGTGQMLYDEQIGRGALGLAGVSQAPFRAWLHHWEVSGDPDACLDCFNVNINVRADEFSLNLQLASADAPVLHGGAGFSRKSMSGNNASYYYSLTRLHTSGNLMSGTSVFNVTGDSWFDHEWSSAMLPVDYAGWDWFSMQLSDQSEIMLFRLRHRSDTLQDFYAGTQVNRAGIATSLEAEEIRLVPTTTWQSPVSGTSYPSTWDVTVGKSRFRVSPKIQDQELNTSFRYWEGSVDIMGLTDPLIHGHGYMELTGYE